MDLALINKQASEDLTSFEGNDFSNPNGYGVRRYTGYNDDLVDFAGKGVGFADSLATNRIFTMVITNTTGVGKNILLSPSYVPAIGANTHVIKEGLIIAGLNANGNPKSIDEFIAWINLNPTQVVAMRLQSNLSAQLQTTMNIVRKSPFKSLENESINIGSFVSEANNNDKLVTVNRPFQMDNQTEISLFVPDTAITTVTLFCGGVLNTAAALNNKFQKAVAQHQ